MRRMLPHVIAVGGTIMLGWWATLVRQAGAAVSARELGMSWSHYYGAFVLWTLAGLCLALPTVATALAGPRRFAIHWPTLVLYGAPGLALALMSSLWMLAGSLGLSWIPDWFPFMHRYGGELMGSLLVGFGVAQALTHRATRLPASTSNDWHAN
ncbi:MAG TPA: hypothetical protein VD969_22425 [Symbiobacteriaceae bacterium]|nr:hypothetical protein [Symbiobacteriaceae bacterium]